MHVEDLMCALSCCCAERCQRRCFANWHPDWLHVLRPKGSSGGLITVQDSQVRLTLLKRQVAKLEAKFDNRLDAQTGA